MAGTLLKLRNSIHADKGKQSPRLEYRESEIHWFPLLMVIIIILLWREIVCSGGVLESEKNPTAQGTNIYEWNISSDPNTDTHHCPTVPQTQPSCILERIIIMHSVVCRLVSVELVIIN